MPAMFRACLLSRVSGGAYSGEYFAFGLPASEMRLTNPGGQH